MNPSDRNPPDDLDDGPAERLKRARLAAGYAKAADFQSAFSLNQSTYSHHEKGTRSITLKMAAKYAGLLKNVTAGWILTGEGEEPKVLPPKSSRGKRPGSVNAKVSGNSEHKLLDEKLLFLWNHFDNDGKIAILRVMEAVSALLNKKIG